MACPTESDYEDDCCEDYSQDFECPDVFQSTLVQEEIAPFCGCSDEQVCGCNLDSESYDESSDTSTETSSDTSSESSGSTDSECGKISNQCNAAPCGGGGAPFNIYHDSEGCDDSNSLDEFEQLERECECEGSVDEFETCPDNSSLYETGEEEDDCGRCG